MFVKPETRYTEIGVRSHGRGVFHKEPITGEDLGNKRVFWLKPGTLVFNIVFAWERSVAVLSEDEAGLIASHRFPMYEMLPGRAHAGFMKHYFTTGYGHYLLRLNSPGAAGRNKTLNQSALMKEEVWLPPAETQRAIADFLDRKTAAIDALISKKERLLALLAEQRAALIHRAVTRGLAPDVEMKDSGVEWIGQVPAHWEVMQIRRVLGELCDGPFGSSLKSEHYSEQGVRVIRLQNIRRAEFNDGDAAYIPGEYFASLPGHEAYPGDLLIAGLGDKNNPVGRACVLPTSVPVSLVKADCYRARLDQRRLSHAFAAEYLSSEAGATGTRLATRGATRSRINLEIVRDAWVPVPPLAEQAAVAAEARRLRERIGGIESRAEQQLDRLREYRQALITAAVTGQLDLSSEAAA